MARLLRACTALAGTGIQFPASMPDNAQPLVAPAPGESDALLWPL